MNFASLTKNEKKVLYNLVSYPELSDTDLAKKINIKTSTFSTIKRKLSDQRYYKNLYAPLLSKLGAELLAVIYTQFNPVIPLEKRVEKTKKTIEVFDEIFFSVGEQEKGFSISISENYTNIGRINEIRTDTFGKIGLLETEYPSEVIFPFETSKIHRFLDFSRALEKLFFTSGNERNKSSEKDFDKNQINLSEKEKKVYEEIVRNPDFTTEQIGKKVDLSRHTISRMKKSFLDRNLIKKITVPNISKLGYEIIAFYHFNFNPKKAPNNSDIQHLDDDSTIFFASKKFEAVMISIYPTYQDYKEDKMEKIRYLKENDLISYTPLVRKYILERMIVIKNFEFASLARKILKTKN